MSIKIPISASVDTAAATSSIDSLIKKLQALQNAANKNNKFQQTGNFTESLAAISSVPPKKAKVLEAASSSPTLTRFLKGSRSNAAAITGGEAEAALAEVKKLLSNAGLDKSIRKPLQDVQSALEEMLKESLSGARLAIKDMLGENLAAVARAEGVGDSPEEILALIQRIDKAVVGNIEAELKTLETIIEKGGPQAAVKKISQLLADVDLSIGTYIKTQQDKIKNALLKGGDRNKATLSNAVSEGNAAAVTAQLKSVMMGGAGDLDNKQLKNIRGNAEALLAGLPTAGTDAAVEELRATLVATIAGLNSTLTEVADKVEEVKVEAVSAESKVEAATESAGADVKKAVEKIAEVVEDAGEKALADVTAAASKPGKAPRKTTEELAAEAYDKKYKTADARMRAAEDARAAAAARRASSGGGGGRGGRGGGGSGGADGGGEGPSLKSAIASAAQEMQRAISIIKDVKGLDTIDDLVQLNRGVVIETNKFFDVVKREFAKAIDAIDEGKGDIAQGILFDSMLKDAAIVSPLRGQQRAFTEAGLADQKIADLKAAGINLDPEQEQAVRRDYLQALAAAAAAYRNMSDATRNYNAKEFEERRSQGEALARQGKADEARATVRNVEVARPVLAANPKEITADTLRAKATLTGERGADSAMLIALGATDKDAKDGVQNVRRVEQEIDKANNKNAPKSALDRLASFGGKVSSAFNLLQMTVGQSIMYMRDFLNEANKLEKTSATVSALTGDFSKYTKVMAIASAQQKKFGGSLNEQLEGFTSLVPITKKFNVDIAQLDNIARRLAIVDPLQGFQGASIALKEFFSGDITSLSRRFEIDRATLNNIKGVGDQVAQLQELDKVLNGLGISNAVLEARANTSAASFDRFGGAIENVKVLIGQGFQNTFGGMAEDIATNLESVGEAIAENLKIEEQKNQIVKDISKLASDYDGLRVVYSQPLPGDSFDKVRKSIEGTTLSMGYLIKETNVVIDRLNEIRLEKGLPTIQRYGRNENVNVALATQGINLGIDPTELYGSRTSTDSQGIGGRDLVSKELVAVLAELRASQIVTTDEIVDAMSGGAATGGDVGMAVLTLLKRYTGLGPGSPGEEERNNQLSKTIGITADQFTNLYDNIKLTNEQFFLVSKSSEMLAGILDENIDVETRLANERKAKAFIATTPGALQLQNQMPGQSGQDVLKEYFKGQYAEALNMDDPVKKGEKFLEIVQQIFNLMNTNGNVMLPLAEQIKVVTKSYNDIGFAAEHVNKLIEKANSFEQQRGDNLRSTLAYQYQLVSATDAVSANAIKQHALNLGLIQDSNELGMSAEAQLKFIAQQERTQARFTLEADRSVDAITALSSLLSPSGKIKMGMEEIANLAVEMRQSFANISLNQLLPTASIQDQYMFQSERLRGGTKANQAFGPRNAQDSENILGTIIGLYQQKTQDKGGSKTGEELLKLEKDYNKDREKARKEHEKDMYDLNEKYLKDLLELQRKSELTKRTTPLNFYKNMQGLENLTPEQRQAYAARFEEGRTEAGKLRAEGKFTAAEEVMQGTADLVFNEASNQNEILQNQKDITEAEKELGELKKDLAAEGDAAKRQEIQDKITLKNEEIARYNNNIANINSLKQMQFDADNEVIVQARLKEETITKDYETELDNRKKAHDEKLADMKTKYDENVADKMKADNAQRDNYIANQEIMSRFADAAIAREQLAQGILGGLPMNRIDALYENLAKTQQAAVESLPKDLQQNAGEYFKSLSELKPSPTQEGMDLAETPMDKHTTALNEMVPVLNRHAKAMEDFNKRFGVKTSDIPEYVRVQLGIQP